MRKFALIKNNVVVETRMIDINNLGDEFREFDLIIDIEDQIPQPSSGWVLLGNELKIPNSSTDREKFEIELNDRKCTFGRSLSRHAVNRVGARNKILNKTGSQVSSLLTELLPIKILLETGALGTARYLCSQLKTGYTEYADIFDEIISQVNTFEANFGL